jgi:hypothetical protein
MRPTLLCAIVLLGCMGIHPPAAADDSARQSLLTAELEYADAMDAHAAIETIESGLVTSVDGRTLDDWQKRRGQSTAAVRRKLSAVPIADLADPDDRRAHAIMSANVDAVSSEPSMAPTARCADAQRRDLPAAALRAALYACFDQHAREIRFEDHALTRLAVFEQLSRIDEPQRRRELFLAMRPLWTSINGRNEPDSPYRRMLRATVAEPGWISPVASAARALGIPQEQVETWLVSILEAWSHIDRGEKIEPWDYRHRQGAASRALARCIARDAVVPASQRFYRDLGADLDALGVVHDVEVRAGKAPLAYASVVRYGREVEGAWRPAIPRVSVNLQSGGLEALGELVHEDAHAVQFAAIRARPAFAAGSLEEDAIFWEAFADVPAWSIYEPAWQRKYLGCEATAADAMRARYGIAMLDVAWGLFEVRLLRDPTLDPNALWTDITSRYLHIVPHPELSWWAVRVQLTDVPGYMVTYGLGTALTADLRARTVAAVGPFDTGNERWFAWLSEHLLRDGARMPTHDLLQSFLGRAPSPEALVAELHLVRDATVYR